MNQPKEATNESHPSGFTMNLRTLENTTADLELDKQGQSKILGQAEQKEIETFYWHCIMQLSVA